MSKCRNEISRVKIWALWAKWARDGRDITNSHFDLCNGTYRHEIPATNVNRCALSTLIDEFIKVSFKGVILPSNRHFLAVLTGLRLTCLQLTNYVSGLRQAFRLDEKASGVCSPNLLSV